MMARLSYFVFRLSYFVSRLSSLVFRISSLVFRISYCVGVASRLRKSAYSLQLLPRKLLAQKLPRKLLPQNLPLPASFPVPLVNIAIFDTTIATTITATIAIVAACIITTTMVIITAATLALAIELPEGAKQYYKDRISSAPGVSEGVGPTREPQTQKGVDIGGRQTQKEYDFSDESSLALTIMAWEALNKKDESGVLAYTLRCIELYEDKAKQEQASLKDFAPSGSEQNYQSLNDVAACYFIQGEFYKYKKDWEKAKAAYQKVVDEFGFAQYWDPRGWWWKPAEISQGEIKKIASGYYEKK